MVTGGAGFIGSALIRYLMNNTEHQVLNIDKLTYASSLHSLNSFKGDSRYNFAQLDICDKEIFNIINEFHPDLIMNLAAESHVDRSIDSAATFIQTNIVGTFNLLEASRHYFATLNSEQKKYFRFTMRLVAPRRVQKKTLVLANMKPSLMQRALCLLIVARRKKSTLLQYWRSRINKGLIQPF